MLVDYKCFAYFNEDLGEVATNIVRVYKVSPRYGAMVREYMLER